MLRSSIRGRIIRKYFSSKSTEIFTPNANIVDVTSEGVEVPHLLKKYIDKPTIKPRQEMLSPEYIADLIIKPSINDLFFSSFSVNSPFLGDVNHKIIPKDVTDETTSVNLIHANIAKEYFTAFNKTIKRLNRLPNPPVIPLNQTIELSIQEQISRYQEDTGEFNLFDSSSLSHLGDILQLAETYRMNLEGKQDASLSNSVVTVDNFCIFLLSQLETEHPESYGETINFIESNLEIFSTNGLLTIIQLILLKFKNTNDPEINKKFHEFMTKIYADYSHITSKLDFYSIDILSRKASQNGEYERGKEVLKSLIQTNHLLPTTDTITKYFESVIKCFPNITYVEFVRETCFVKPALFQGPISSKTASIILKYGINDSIELEHFLKLVSTNKNKMIIPEIADEIIIKSINLYDISNSVQVTQLIVRLKKEGASFNQETINQLKAYYKENGPSNVRYLDNI